MKRLGDAFWYIRFSLHACVIHQLQGNVILLKDLTNIRTATLHGNSRNDLDKTINSLKEKYGKFLIKLHPLSLAHNYVSVCVQLIKARSGGIPH